jgi:hypothetical protein
MWRTTLGEPGRLQTQQILGNPIARKEVNLHIVELPSRVLLERPFLVRLSVSNQTDRHIGPLQISMSQDDAQGVSRAIVVNGLWTMVVPQLEPFASTDFNLVFFLELFLVNCHLFYFILPSIINLCILPFKWVFCVFFPSC